jgi:hypothetical protein
LSGKFEGDNKKHTGRRSGAAEIRIGKIMFFLKIYITAALITLAGVCWIRIDKCFRDGGEYPPTFIMIVQTVMIFGGIITAFVSVILSVWYQ